MKVFLKSQLAEIRQNKLRIGLLTLILLGTLLYSVTDFEAAEEINLDAPTENLSAKKISSTEKVKAVIGANNEEFYIYNPFQNPAPPAEEVEEVEQPEKVEVPIELVEKILPPIEPVVIEKPIEKVEEVSKPPAEKFKLRGTALGVEKSALVEKVVEDKSEVFFVKIGDKINGKIISDIKSDCIVFADESIMNIEIP